MRWVNVETPTFAGAGGNKPAIVERMELRDHNENVSAWIEKDVAGNITSSFDAVDTGVAQNTLLKSGANGEPVASQISDDGANISIAAGTGALDLAANDASVTIVGNKDDVDAVVIRGGSNSGITIGGDSFRTIVVGGFGATLTMDALNDTATMDATAFIVLNLPTSDPAVAGQLYNLSGVLMVSAG